MRKSLAKQAEIFDLSVSVGRFAGHRRNTKTGKRGIVRIYDVCRKIAKQFQNYQTRNRFRGSLLASPNTTHGKAGRCF